MAAANRNPFKLTDHQIEVLELYIRHGDPKLVAYELERHYTNVNDTLNRAAKRMGVRNRVLAALKWDREVNRRPIAVNSVFAMAANEGSKHVDTQRLDDRAQRSA